MDITVRMAYISRLLQSCLGWCCLRLVFRTFVVESSLSLRVRNVLFLQFHSRYTFVGYFHDFSFYFVIDGHFVHHQYRYRLGFVQDYISFGEKHLRHTLVDEEGFKKNSNCGVADDPEQDAYASFSHA